MKCVALPSEVATAAYNDLTLPIDSVDEDALPKPTVESGRRRGAQRLVSRRRTIAFDDFRAAVTEFVRVHERRGFRVEFTGPWPPYHFTRDVADVQ